MKKLLTIILLSTICLSLSANPDSLKLNKDPIPDTSQITLTKVYNDVKSGLNGLGEALKVGSEHVYGVLIKQQLANSVTYLVDYIFCFIILFIGYKQFKKKWFIDAVEDRYGWDFQAIIYCVFYFTTLSATLGFIMSTLNDCIVGFYNPEYSAIKEIITFIK